jgi:hypothetical protein
MLSTQVDEVMIIQIINKGKKLARRSSFPYLQLAVPLGVTQRIQSMPWVP